MSFLASSSAGEHHHQQQEEGVQCSRQQVEEHQHRQQEEGVHCSRQQEEEHHHLGKQQGEVQRSQLQVGEHLQSEVLPHTFAAEELHRRHKTG